MAGGGDEFCFDSLLRFINLIFIVAPDNRFFADAEEDDGTLTLAEGDDIGVLELAVSTLPTLVFMGSCRFFVDFFADKSFLFR